MSVCHHVCMCMLCMPDARGSQEEEDIRPLKTRVHIPLIHIYLFVVVSCSHVEPNCIHSDNDLKVPILRSSVCMYSLVEEGRGAGTLPFVLMLP